MVDNGEATPLEKLMGLFQVKMQQIEALEEKLEQRVHQARRRLWALNPSPVRQTHLRLFISHSYAPEITNSGAMAALMKGQDTKPSPPIWKLHIEGKLLVDHLDFEAADAFDGNMKCKAPSEDKNAKVEDEEAVADAKVRPPVKTSQLFFKISVGFQTIFEPIKTAKSPTKKNKKPPRRSSNSNKTLSSPTKVEEEPNLPSAKQVISYKCCDQPGADIWSFQYVEPPSPDPTKWKAESVVAYVDLYRRFQYPTTTGREHKRFRIKSPALQRAFFPNHGPVTNDALTGRKRNLRDAITEIPTHNEVHVPTSVTMEELTSIFFTYIQDKKLTSETDPTVVVADKLLQDLLGMEQFPFSQLQQLLFTRYLIEPINYEDPIRILYIMETSTASVLGEPGGDTLQLDVDCIVPSLFPVRVRELMRRVKRRETDYSSSRTKARYLIPHDRDDRRMREVIDTAVSHTEIGADFVPFHMALAVATPEGSEARTTARRDAQICYFMGQLQDRVPATAKVRERYEILREQFDAAIQDHIDPQL